jgi:glycine/D-amino acid oxidase-like deaminating enzyme
MSKILVLGGGIVGLSTAMMLARRGHDVTVFERDSNPLPASPEDAWQGWERSVAQFRQPHYLHPPAIELLDSHLPDIKEAFAMMYDSDLFRAWLEIRSVQALPQEIMARPGVVDRIMQVASTHEAVIPLGPSREELLRMLHSERREIQCVPA